MATADSNESSPTSSRKSDNFFNLLGRFGADVELWSAMESLGPGMVSAGGESAEGDGGVCPGQLSLHEGIQFRIHGRSESG